MKAERRRASIPANLPGGAVTLLSLVLIVPSFAAEPASPDVTVAGAGPRRPPPPPPRHRRSPPPRHVPADPAHNVSLTVNLLDLPSPLVSAGLEAALGRHVGVTATGGLGAGEGLALYEVGGDLRGYFVGDFDRGFSVGGGVGYTNLTPMQVGESATTLAGFVGGKYTFPIGLTLQGSVGAETFVNEQRAVLYPAAKVGVGWSF